MELPGLNRDKAPQVVAQSLDQWQDKQWLALDLIKSFGVDAGQAVEVGDRQALQATFEQLLRDVFGFDVCSFIAVTGNPADAQPVDGIVDADLRVAYGNLIASGKMRQALYDLPPSPRTVDGASILVAPIDFNQPTMSHVAALIDDAASWSGMRGRMLEFILDQANAHFEALSLVEQARDKATDLQKVVHDKDEHIAFQNSHDNLTGLRTRENLLERLDAVFERDEEPQLIALGLRGFGRVNHRYGYPRGDALLREIAQRLTSETADISERVTLARIADDRFAVVLHEGSHEPREEAMRLARQMCSRLCVGLTAGDDLLTLSVQIGVASAPDDAANARELINAAELALDAIDRAVGVNIQLFSELDESERLDNSLLIETEINAGLVRGDFSMWYQPKVDMVSEKVVGAEALMRWHHPEMGRVSPVHFIPAAERSGQIVELGELALRQACKQLSAWRREGFDPGLISVNLSPIQVSTVDLPSRFQTILREECIEASSLELEVTETAVSRDIDAASRVISELHAQGFTISIDDFGTGYSSLLLLRQLPINVIKIDRAFIRDLDVNGDDLAIVRAVLSMAADLGMKVVAEGVETLSQFSTLRDLGCDQLQGALASMPMPRSEFDVFVRSWSGLQDHTARKRDPG